MTNWNKAKTGMAAAVLAASAIAETAHATAFTPGDLVVSRAVGGVVDLTTSPAPGSVAPITSAAFLGNGVAATVELDEYTPSGTLVQSITLPNVAQTNTAAGSTYALTLSGPQTQEGTIELSGDGRYFSLAGYNQTAGQTNLINANGTNAAPAASVQRVVGIIAMDGSVNTTTGLTDVANAVSVRSAWTSDGTNIWVEGAAKNATQLSGIHYTTVGSTTSTIITAVDSSGGTNIVNGFNFGSGLQLVASSLKTTTAAAGSAFFRGVATVGDATLGPGMGLPTAASTTLDPAQLPGFDSTNTPPAGEVADGFWFKDANTLYVADNRNSTSSGSGNAQFGGVQKWTNVSGVWTFQYNVTLGNGTAGTLVGAHGLSGSVDAQGNVDLYATTFDPGPFNTNQLYSIVDPVTPNTTPSFDTPTLLATSATNSAFRGVAVVPSAIVPILLGDANGDGHVDLSDLSIVLNNFGETTSLRSNGNFDGGPTIDLTDLSDVLNNFGQSLPGASTASLAATPEPGSLALLGLGVARILIRRRRA